MKTDREAEEMLCAIPQEMTFGNDSYQEGVQDALRWFLGELSDNELLTGDED